MTQHINLLSKPGARQHLTLLAVVALAVAILSMLALAGMDEWELYKLRQSEAQVRQSVDGLKATLAAKRREAGTSDSENLAKQLALLRSQFEARRDWAELLQKGELGAPQGYSQLFETLASVHEEGVWLQGLDIGKGGQSMSITGKSLSAEAVMRYIERINEALKPMDIAFTSMDITQDEPADAAASRKGAVLKFKLF